MKLKKMKSNFRIVVTGLICILSVGAFAQTNGKDYAEITIYRAKQGTMSGATMMDAKIKMNEKEIGSVLNATKLKYKIYSEGSVKIACIGMIAGGPIGKPYVTTIAVKKGEEYHIALTLSNMSGVSGIIMGEKELKKMEKEKFVDQTELEEDKANPVIK